MQVWQSDSPWQWTIIHSSRSSLDISMVLPWRITVSFGGGDENRTNQITTWLYWLYLPWVNSPNPIIALKNCDLPSFLRHVPISWQQLKTTFPLVVCRIWPVTASIECQILLLLTPFAIKSLIDCAEGAFKSLIFFNTEQAVKINLHWLDDRTGIFIVEDKPNNKCVFYTNCISLQFFFLKNVAQVSVYNRTFPIKIVQPSALDSAKRFPVPSAL